MLVELVFADVRFFGPLTLRCLFDDETLAEAWIDRMVALLTPLYGPAEVIYGSARSPAD